MSSLFRNSPLTNVTFPFSSNSVQRNRGSSSVLEASVLPRLKRFPSAPSSVKLVIGGEVEFFHFWYDSFLNNQLCHQRLLFVETLREEPCLVRLTHSIDLVASERVVSEVRSWDDFRGVEIFTAGHTGRKEASICAKQGAGLNRIQVALVLFHRFEAIFVVLALCFVGLEVKKKDSDCDFRNRSRFGEGANGFSEGTTSILPDCREILYNDGNRARCW